MIFKMQGLGDKGEVYDDTERKTKITFDDIAGLDEEKGELKELVQFLKKPEKFAEMGAKIPKGVLLVGPPGTGKTLLAKAVAHETNATFIKIVASEFVNKYLGEGSRIVRDVFENGENHPLTLDIILFFF